MARQTTIVQVFVASPSDVQEERAILETVITQLNQIWGKTLGLIFELLKWETAVYPAFSSDPQAVINEQVGFEYDVFIGIFWGRLGTATPRAMSGTLEEFERAYSRRSAAVSAPDIMLYFKDAPIAPSKLDPDQLKGVQDFKRSLADRGGLYSNFENVAEFESSVRAHLSVVAQKFAQSSAIAIDSSAGIQPLPTMGDELGYLDHIDIYQYKMTEMIIATEKINEATERIGEQVIQHTIKLEKNSPSNPKVARRLIDNIADDMKSYASTMQTQVSVFSTARVAALSALSIALSMHSEFSDNNSNDLQDLRDSLLSMKEGASTAKMGMAGMRNATDSIPRMSKELNQAKRVVVLQIDAFLNEIDSIHLTVNNIVGIIDQMLGDLKSAAADV